MKELMIQEYDAVVVGTGAAGYHAACRIKEDGRKTVCIVTEGVNWGTSRNTGSDKQTYYKLGLGGSAPDSVRQMAANLFAGGSVDGDNALCEAALSARCFYHLCEEGVPFPCNRYGEFVGYKTDHDPYARATSAGPLTSKFMTEALEKRAGTLEIPVYDGLLAIEILKSGDGVCGLLCVDIASGDFYAFRCANVVMATGGPAGIYADSVYPGSQSGSTGLALRAGASLQNMTEWQYGLASTKPRWNVSGTYMQVLPRFVSVDEAGVEREFLADYFADPYEALSTVFLKGYQWPFDSKKVLNGSSVIDLLVYRETAILNRKVFLDYRTNPFGLEQIAYEKLSGEAYGYLKSAEACFGTPIERLTKMNQPAIELYQSKGVDLYTSELPIALCAQHNNGGIAVDAWWQTCVPGLFAAGECAGTHGIARPGGSALNAGQVGSLRAAQYLSASDRKSEQSRGFEEALKEALDRQKLFCKNALEQSATTENRQEATEALYNARIRMSHLGGAIREKENMTVALNAVKEELAHFTEHYMVTGADKLHRIYRLYDALTVQYVMLTALLDYAEVIKASRGSALYYDPAGDLRDGLEEQFRLSVEIDGYSAGLVQQVSLVEDDCHVIWRKVRPLPEDNDFFENVWRQYRENRNIV